MTAVGFEPTQLALVELESTPLDHSGKLSLRTCHPVRAFDSEPRRGTAAGPTARGGETCQCLLETSRRPGEGAPVCPCADLLQKLLCTTCLFSFVGRQPAQQAGNRGMESRRRLSLRSPLAGELCICKCTCLQMHNACLRIARACKSTRACACTNTRPR